MVPGRLTDLNKIWYYGLVSGLRLPLPSFTCVEVLKLLEGQYFQLPPLQVTRPITNNLPCTNVPGSDLFTRVQPKLTLQNANATSEKVYFYLGIFITHYRCGRSMNDELWCIVSALAEKPQLLLTLKCRPVTYRQSLTMYQSFIIRVAVF